MEEQDGVAVGCWANGGAGDRLSGTAGLAELAGDLHGMAREIASA
jgi:NAD(P)H-hydrate repair Nnr-like enzyme with NAD(P)H-hydrate dehydratase domain